MTRTEQSNTGSAVRALALALLVAACASAGGCRGDRSDSPPRQFFPDMDDQPRWNPQSETEFFVNSRTMRQEVQGTVPFGRWYTVSDAAWAADRRKDRADRLREDTSVYFGTGENGAYIERIPVEVTRELLNRGEERFNIYCAVCHGYLGDGAGAVGGLWATPIPTFHDDKYRPGGELGQDGYIYNVAMNGVYDVTGAQKMPGYAHALSTDDAWAIVSYFRALQRSQRAELDDVPVGDRQLIERQLNAADGGGS